MRTFSTTRWISSVLFLLVPAFLLGQQTPLTNWTVPPYHRASASGGIKTMTDISPGVGFVAMQPCRIVDTRGGGVFTGTYGPPALAANATRAFDINSAPHCTGIPDGAEAYSLNFTVVTTAGGPGDLRAWPTGNPPVQTTSVLNWTGANVIIANATIIGAGTNGSIDVTAAGFGTQLLIDINGYFTDDYTGGTQFVAVTTLGASAAILGVNNSGVPGSHGVGGFAGGAGVVHGVQGQVGSSALAGSSGVHGINDSTTAAFGVLGETSSTTIGTAGVRGVDAAAGSTDTSGVSGETRSLHGDAAGVFGTATQATGNGGRFRNATIGADTYLSTRVTGVDYAVYALGKIRGSSLDIVGAPKNFVAPHPEDPGLEIRYASVEAPTVDVCFRGTASLVNGSAFIEVPDHFRYTAREGTYMTTLTPVGRPAALWVEQEGPDGIAVRGSGSARFHYVVWAERAEIVGYKPVVKNTTFTPEALEKAGGPQTLPESTRALLVRNGTLHPDGTYDLETARALGWTIPERLKEPARRSD